LQPRQIARAKRRQIFWKVTLGAALSLSKLLEVKFSTLFDVGLRLSEGLSECVENDTAFRLTSQDVTLRIIWHNLSVVHKSVVDEFASLDQWVREGKA
jgi:hypothetical protein